MPDATSIISLDKSAAGGGMRQCIGRVPAAFTQ
jgi:hypothetical protein